MGSKTLALLVSILCAGRASAQPGPPTVLSLDSSVLNANYICVGRIVDDHPERQTNETPIRNVDVTVETRLKGEWSGVSQASIEASAADIRAWKARNSRLLIVEGGTAIDLSDPNLAVVTADMQILRDPKEVVAAAREAIRRHPGVTRIDTVSRQAPIAVARAIAKRGDGPLRVLVPADAALETWAIGALRSKSPVERAEAIHALRHFPSETNANRLRRLLGDPAIIVYGNHRAADNLGHETRTYIVRQAASETLQAWGAAFATPVLEEKAYLPEKVVAVFVLFPDTLAAKWGAIERLPNLRRLYVDAPAFAPEDLDRIVRFARLAELDFPNTGFDDADLGHLTGLKGVETLDLQRSRVGDESVPVLAGMDSLRKVRLGEAKFTAAGLAELKRRRPDLTIDLSIR